MTSSWPPERDKALRELWGAAVPIADIAERLGVGKSSIYARKRVLNLPKRNNPAEGGWSPDTVERLKELWGDGKSAGQIADIINVPRNAVIGKAHRLSLAKRRPSPIKRDPNKPAKKPGPQPKSKPRPARLIGLMDLTWSTCRWPVGDPRDANFCFCGAYSPINRAYCDGHHALAHDPWRPPIGEKPIGRDERAARFVGAVLRATDQVKSVKTADIAVALGLDIKQIRSRVTRAERFGYVQVDRSSGQSNVITITDHGRDAAGSAA